MLSNLTMIGFLIRKNIIMLIQLMEKWVKKNTFLFYCFFYNAFFLNILAKVNRIIWPWPQNNLDHNPNWDCMVEFKRCINLVSFCHGFQLKFCLDFSTSCKYCGQYLTNFATRVGNSYFYKYFYLVKVQKKTKMMEKHSNKLSFKK